MRNVAVFSTELERGSVAKASGEVTVTMGTASDIPTRISTGADVPMAPLLSVARAVNAGVPGDGWRQVKVNVCVRPGGGGTRNSMLDSPIFRPPAKNSILRT